MDADPRQDPQHEALQWALRRIEAELGPLVAVREVIPGTAPGARLLLEIAGRGQVFAKIADGSRWSAEAIGAEAALLTTVGHRHMPQVLASGPTESVPWMVLPDLTGASWPPPWPDGLRGLHRAVRRLRKATPPPWLTQPDDVDPWVGLLAEEGQEWWRPRSVELARAARRVSIAGDDLVHGDLGAGNICLVERQPVVVDWSDAYVGNADIDLVTLAVDIAHTGGPRALPPVRDPGAWLAKVAGLLVTASRRPAWPGPGGAEVRDEQARLSRTAVAWAVDLLDR